MQTAQEDVFPTESPVPLSVLNASSHYLVWVQASNALGMARSAPQHLDLQQLGTPVAHTVPCTGAATVSPSGTLCPHGAAMPG